MHCTMKWCVFLFLQILIIILKKNAIWPVEQIHVFLHSSGNDALHSNSLRKTL